MDAMTLEQVAAETDLDPKFVSRTSARVYLAQDRIPDYIGQLMNRVERGEMLSMREIELAYNEYRQLHRGKRPFRMRLPKVKPVAWNEADVLFRLEALSRPERIIRRTAYELLLGLWAQVQE